MWYHLRVTDSQILENACWCYPEPRTHVEIRDHVTFALGKGVALQRSAKEAGAPQPTAGRASAESGARNSKRTPAPADLLSILSGHGSSLRSAAELLYFVVD